MTGVIEPINPDGKTRTKATLLRGWNRVLAREGKLERILDRLTPASGALLGSPPLATTSVDVAHLECVAQAVLEEVGEAELDRLFLAASTEGYASLLTNFVGGLVRAFNPDPAFVLQKVPAAARQTTEGLDLVWTSTGPTSGELVATYLHRARIHPASAWGTRAAVRATERALGRTLEVGRPEVESRGGVTRVRVTVRWS